MIAIVFYSLMCVYSRRYLINGPWLRMWLKAHAGNVVATAKAAVKHFAWRKEYGADTIADEVGFEGRDRYGEMYVSGVDR